MSWDFNPGMSDSKAKDQLWNYRPQLLSSLAGAVRISTPQRSRVQAGHVPLQAELPQNRPWPEGREWETRRVSHTRGDSLQPHLYIKYPSQEGAGGISFTRL